MELLTTYSKMEHLQEAMALVIIKKYISDI